MADRQWYVALVAPRAEKTVRDALLQMGYDAFVASRKELHVWARGQRKIIERVLISCVVFVHAAEHERLQVVSLPFIRSFLTNPASSKNELGRRPAAVIPDAEMQLLQAMLTQNDDEVAFATTDFAVGDIVEVLGLASQPLSARIVRLPGDSHNYVGVQLTSLGCAYMSISPERLIKVKPH
ncbi:MAG: UpxY family transcription antiterminator [Bacteroidaceae bacterium]|nr:UpxY family transcription antiterminator [Bacteroidaceae bacterium]